MTFPGPAGQSNMIAQQKREWEAKSFSLREKVARRAG
jgi:hypothetical protein